MSDPVWIRAHEVFQALFELPEENREKRLRDLRDSDPEVETAVRALLRGHEMVEGPFDRLRTALAAGGRGDDEAPLVTDDPATRWVRIRELGRGGAGVVHLADDTALGRRVAIKTLVHELASSTSARRRLLAEARTVASLDHPNIVPLYEVGVDDQGCVFLVLGYAEGETLRDLLRREERLDLDTALPVAVDIARALAAAHARGVVHRDVKPANVLVGNDGAVKLTDFGIARRPAGTPGHRTFGTPAYMSPEDLDGAEAEPRSDVWSLGIVLHEMLTGEHPTRFDEAVTVELLDDRTDPRWTGVERLLRRMLEADPSARPPHAAAVLEDLEALVTGPRANGRMRRVLALSGVAAAVLGLAAIGFLREPAPPVLPPAEAGSRGHVLWVDDDPELSSAEEAALEEAGFEVGRARSTDEAVAVFDPGVHQVVISDLGRFEEGQYRPEAGLDLLRRLRAREPDVRVVFFTSGRALEVIRTAAAGAQAFGATDSTAEFYRLVAEAAEASQGGRRTVR